MLYLGLTVCINEKDPVLPDIVVTLIVPLARFCQLLLDACRIVVNKGFDFFNSKHFLTPS